MINKELREHQWKAFVRHPMFARSIGVKIFMIITFSFIALEFFALGFMLDKICLELGNYTSPVDCFNSWLLYIIMADFVLKLFMKTNQSMQVAPYLTLPVKRNKLFNFLLRKEFFSMWNWYLMFLVVPFAFKTIPTEYGFLKVPVFILFIFLLGIAVSLLAALTKNWIKSGFWKAIFPAGLLAGILVLAFKFNFPFGDYTRLFGEWILRLNPFAWLAFMACFLMLWFANRYQMRSILYQEMQGEKMKDSVNLFNLTFLDRFGSIGEYISLELKLITRNKRLRTQLFTFVVLLFVFGIQLFSNSVIQKSFFMQLFWFGFIMGGFGMIFSQYLFMSESSYFDGLMARNHSFLDLMRAKYYFYCAVSFVIYLLMLILIYYGKVSFLFLTSVYVYYAGLVTCCYFQNGVYNKSYFDLEGSGLMNWKTTSSSQMLISMLSMFLPLCLAAIIGGVFSQTVACYVMLGIGLTFMLGSNYWLEWTYKRMIKRKYILMDGFRSN